MEKIAERDSLLTVSEGENVEHKKDQLAVIDFKMVTFTLSGKDYAIDILKIKEIAKAGRFTYVPNTAPFVIGVYNLRGEIIPVLDLRIFFNIEVPERTENRLESIIILRFEEQQYGIVVDRIDKVVGIQSSSIQPPHPLFGDINIKYIYGVVENADRLYILLDVNRIFGLKSTQFDGVAAIEQKSAKPFQVHTPRQKVDEVFGAKKSETTKIPDAEAEFFFVKDGLQNLKKFNVSSVNETWVKERYAQWIKQKKGSSVQLSSIDDAESFLQSFYSSNANELWSQHYADILYSVLPNNEAKQIQVWNIGCGTGYDAYSLACLLKKRYPKARVKIYAHDIDLIAISNASLLELPEDIMTTWYADYVTQNVSGQYVFKQDIQSSVLFEYHDCTNLNSLPDLDIIFARDILSFLPNEGLSTVLNDFYEKIKGNGLVFLGDNEILADTTKWQEHSKDSLVSYTKH